MDTRIKNDYSIQSRKKIAKRLQQLFLGTNLQYLFKVPTKATARLGSLKLFLGGANL